MIKAKGGREFKYGGYKYRIENLPSADATQDGKYYIRRMNKSGFYETMYSTYSWVLPKFKTISEARVYVRDWGFTLDSIY